MVHTQRITVFHEEQGFPLEGEIEESVSFFSSNTEAILSDVSRFEDIATHLLRLTPSLFPVGTILTFKVPGAEYYRLSVLAVLEPYRKFRTRTGLEFARMDQDKRIAK